ncbi:hypothetical protein AVEN_121553-1 [Araneus ventricosus]|uniref:Uncharacterized protein n=1 Tax=Araneus ventricosus TaxID=182803 RepID=A0A4Y2GQ53_ARAVE|nr:hypothetical protein AVEN_121553-1 [Araneus ventricosus]
MSININVEFSQMSLEKTQPSKAPLPVGGENALHQKLPGSVGVGVCFFIKSSLAVGVGTSSIKSPWPVGGGVCFYIKSSLAGGE